METNAERRRRKLEAFCNEKGLKAVADAVGLNWQYIDQAIKKTLLPVKKDGTRGYRKMSDEAFEKIEDAYQLGRGWFDEMVTQNTAPGPTIKGEVPLLSTVQAGMYTEFVDNLHPGEGEYEKIPTTVPVNRYTFALRVTGDSMEPDFTEGMLLVVEPELDPQPGDYVIAKNGSEETTFKQLAKDGGDWYLKPLNSRYPIKSLDGCTIIGVVRAVEKRFR
jgi:SOS-response transcriptional repressor LexA